MSEKMMLIQSHDVNGGDPADLGHVARVREPVDRRPRGEHGEVGMTSRIIGPTRSSLAEPEPGHSPLRIFSTHRPDAPIHGRGV